MLKSCSRVWYPASFALPYILSAIISVSMTSTHLFSMHSIQLLRREKMQAPPGTTSQRMPFPWKEDGQDAGTSLS